MFEELQREHADVVVHLWRELLRESLEPHRRLIGADFERFFARAVREVLGLFKEDCLSADETTELLQGLHAARGLFCR